MQYREYAPLPALRLAVETIWTLEGESRPNAEPQAVLPDGRPELVVHFGEPFALVTGSSLTTQAPILFAGQLQSRLLLQPRGRVHIAGVRFHPHGAAALLPVPQHRVTGAPLALDDIDARLRRALNGVRERWTGDLAASTMELQQALAQWIDADRIDARVAHAVHGIARMRGGVSIERLAASAGMTRRHLERRFLDDVGITPKRLARITRFQRALRIIEDDGVAGRGAHAAAECGYADQSHFARDFRALAGCAPSEHLLQQMLIHF